MTTGRVVIPACSVYSLDRDVLRNSVGIMEVTYVLVGDSTVGYGIYIGNMLEAAQVGKANN